ncbi:WG repeat-containing protein, partial [Acidithiobacillus sp.]|uniref:WG repeat-containing protein n=1 Tax=Acidithiobacillus sp. TaxID=1872118 RepID=UPI003CFFAFB3
MNADAVRSAATAPGAPESPVQTAVPARPTSQRSKATYALVVLLVVLGGVAWWWFHRPAPAYRAKDPGIYPFVLSADGKTGKWGFVDANGKVVIQPEWDKVAWESVLNQSVVFNEGLCGVEKDGKWGYIDTSGHLVISNQFDSAAPFFEGLARVNLGKLVGYIDKTGRYAINPQFNNAGDFHEGLAAVQTDAGWGFIDKSGNYAVKPHFQQADINGFSEGLAAVCEDGKCGFINRSGTFIISPQFDTVGAFVDGLAPVSINNKGGYINSAGKIVINPQFDWETTFFDGLAVVSVSGQEGTINKKGKYVVNPGQFTIVPGGGDLDIVDSSNGIGLLTRGGKWVVQPSKALTGYGAVLGKVFYGMINGQVVPISSSGIVLAGWYKGAFLQTLAQDIQDETNAINSLRNLMNAESSYSAAYPTKGFTDSIGKLGPASGTPDENHANLIDAALASGAKDNYQFSISIPPGTSVAGANFNYFILAKPVAGHFGISLCADSSGTIHYGVQGETCTTSSPIAANDTSPSSGGMASTLSLGSSLWRCYAIINGQWQPRDPQPNLFAKVSDGLKFNGVGYRGSVAAFSVTSIPLTSSTVRFRWKLDGAHDYMGFQPNLVFFNAPPSDPSSLKALPLSTHAFTTDHSWDNSYFIQDNTWYYTVISIQAGTLISMSCATAEDSYPDRGGRVIDRTT